MKVLMVSAAILPWETHGVSVHVDHLVRELAREHEVTLLYTSPITTTSEDLETKVNNGIREVWVPNKRAEYGLHFPGNTPSEFIGASFSMTQAWADLQDFILEEQFDLIHIHDYYASLFIELVRETVDCPIVVTVHALSRDQGHFGTGLRSWMLKQADAVIAVSDDLSFRINDTYGKQISCTVIPNGIASITGAELTPLDKKKYITFAGRLERDKGCDLLLMALDKIGADRLKLQGLTVQILGDGSQLENLKQQATYSGLEEVVYFQGHVAHEDVSTYLNLSALHVVPSRNESFGLSAVEGLAAGVPVLASDVGGLPEVVSGNPLARLVNAEDINALHIAIKEMLAQEFSIEQREEARSMITQKYAWDEITRKTTELYEKVLRENRR